MPAHSDSDRSKLGARNARQIFFWISDFSDRTDRTTISFGRNSATHGRGNADAAVDLINDGITPLRASDHDGLVLFVTKDKDSDGVNDDADVCPATVIPEMLQRDLGKNRFALTDSDFDFDTNASKGKGPGRSYSTLDTAGCSCTQIIDAQGLGNGHKKFGCSIGAMDNWKKLVQ